MKRYTIGLITLLLIVGCGKKEDGLHTEEFEEPIYGRMSRTGNYKDGKKDGVWFFYITYSNPPDTTLMWSKTYKDGKVDGLYTNYLTTEEEIWARKDFVDLDGKVFKKRQKKFIAPGQKVEEGINKEGKDDRDRYIRVGVWTTWYIHGQKKSERTYEDGGIIGETFWYEDEKWSDRKNDEKNLGKKETNYSTTLGDYPITRTITLLYDNGQKALEGTGEKVGHWENWTKEGLETSWYLTGEKKEEGTYKDDKKVGVWTIWSPNRNYPESREVTYKDGRGDGLVTRWYDNGQKEEEGFYKDGKEDGLFTRWYDNGWKKSEKTYKDGKVDGLFIWWYENGRRRGEETYKNGVKDGLETNWNKNGKITYQERYVNGRISGGSSSLLCDCNNNYGSLSTSQKRECDKMTDGLSSFEIQQLLLLEQCD